MSDSNKPCLICGEGQLTQTIGNDSVSYKRVFRELPLYLNMCDTYGSEQADAQDVRLDRRAMLRSEKKSSYLPT